MPSHENKRSLSGRARWPFQRRCPRSPWWGHGSLQGHPPGQRARCLTPSRPCHPPRRQGSRTRRPHWPTGPGPATGGQAGQHGHRRGKTEGSPGHGPAARQARPGRGWASEWAAALAPSTGTITPEAFPYPFPYDSFTPAWGLWPTYPYDLNGKLFFTNGGNALRLLGDLGRVGERRQDRERDLDRRSLPREHRERTTMSTDTFAVFIPAFNAGTCAKNRPVR